MLFTSHTTQNIVAGIMIGLNESKGDSMWDIPFEQSMLTDNCDIAISCPHMALAQELFEVFKQNNITWSETSTRWREYKGETVYCVSKDGVLKYGSKNAVENIRPYSDYIKCTFYGAQDEEFEVADDESLLSFLGIK